MSSLRFLYDLPQSFMRAMSPPLLTRLRNRLSSSPAKVVQSLSQVTTAEEQEADRVALEKAVAQAVSAALNNEDFTKAVATELALQIQPSIQSALDISAVEKKLLASNDDLSNRLSDVNTDSTKKISDLSALVENNNTMNESKLAALGDAIETVSQSLSELGNHVTTIQEQVASPDTSILSSHTLKLDTINIALQKVHDSGTSVGSALSTQAVKLEALATELTAVKNDVKTLDALKTIFAELAFIKSDIEASISAGSTSISDVSTKLTEIMSAIDSQNVTLADFKAGDESDDILAGIKASNEFHLAHASTLAAIKSTNELISPAIFDLRSQVDEMKSAMPTILMADIFEAVKTSNDSHKAHAADLAEIKSSNIGPEILAAVKTASESLTATNASLSEINLVVSTAPASVEKTDLSGLESLLESLTNSIDSQAIALREIRAKVETPIPAPEKVNLADVEASLHKVIGALDSQTTTLFDIKSTLSVPAAEKLDLTGLTNSVQKVITTLETQSSAISDIKAIPGKTDISSLETSFKTVVATLDTQASALSDIKTSITTTSAGTIAKTDIIDLESSVQRVVDSLADQTSTLSNIKSTISTPVAMAEKVDTSTLAEKKDLRSLEASVQKVIETLGSQTSSLAEIRTSIAIPAAVAEKVDVSDLALESSIQKVIESLGSQYSAISEIKTTISTAAPPEEKVDISGLAQESSVQKIFNTLEAQTSTITELTTVVLNPAPAAKVDLSDLETSVQKIISTIDSQSITLSEINTSTAATDASTRIEAVRADITAVNSKLDSLSTGDILAEVKSVKTLIEAIPSPAAPKDEKTSNDDIFQELKSVSALVKGTAVPTSKDDEILSEVKAVRGLFEKGLVRISSSTNGVEGNDQRVEVPAAKETENGVKVDTVAIEKSTE